MHASTCHIAGQQPRYSLPSAISQTVKRFMLPSIGIVLGVEMLRDGGSLAATFQGSNGCEYWLVLPVQLASGTMERLGYGKPVVVDRLAQREIPIKWQDARILLNQIEPLLENDRDRKWCATMQEVILTEGTLPGGINP